jgi:hypothetical protein
MGSSSVLQPASVTLAKTPESVITTLIGGPRLLDSLRNALQLDVFKRRIIGWYADSSTAADFDHSTTDIAMDV